MSAHRRGRGSGTARQRIRAARGARPPEPAAPRLTDAEAAEIVRAEKRWLDDLRSQGYRVPDSPRARAVDEAAAALEREGGAT